MPSRLHSLTTLSPKLREPLVLGPLGLEVADRVADVVHELHVAEAEIVGRLQRAKIAVEEARAFDREHDVGLARHCTIDIGRRQHDLQALLGEVPLDARHLLLEPVQRFAWARDRRSA